MSSLESNQPCEWQVECSTIKQRSVNLYRSQLWTDCRFCFGDGVQTEFIDAHTLVLAMASPVFAAMFFGVAGNKENPIKIVDIDLLTFESMLDYIYTEEIFLQNLEDAMNLCLAANKYILPHLEMACVMYLVNHLNPDNVCGLYEFACFCGDETIKRSCIQMIRTRTLEVLKGESFKEVQLSTMKEIVAMDPLNIESELDLINAIFSYFKEDSIDKTEFEDVGRKYKVDINKIPGTRRCKRTNQQKKILIKSSGNITKTKKYNFSINENNNIQLMESKRNNLREKMTGIVEYLRFLRLTPTQLAKCRKLQLVLTKEELFALSMRISTPLIQMPVPSKLSVSVLPRNDRSQNCIKTRIVLKNLSRFVPPGSFKGDYFCAQNIPFELLIRIHKSKINETKNEKCLVIFVCCKKNCEVNFKSKLVSFKPSVTASQQMEIEKTIFYGSYQREHRFKYSMRKIRDPDVGVLIDDCLIVDINIAPIAIFSPPDEHLTNTGQPIGGDHLQKMRDYLNTISSRRY